MRLVICSFDIMIAVEGRTSQQVRPTGKSRLVYVHIKP
jgi:hypothetical protein